MIRTSTQLKAKVRNLSAGDNDRAKLLIRNFVMERFLERVALSQYRNNFILKGGMLVAAVVGLEARATMDIDTTVKSKLIDLHMSRTELAEKAGISRGEEDEGHKPKCYAPRSELNAKDIVSVDDGRRPKRLVGDPAPDRQSWGTVA